MLNIFSLANGRLFQEEIESLEELSRFQPIWVDLESPTLEEKRWVKQYYGLSIPEDAMDEDIEESARFYEEDNGELHIRSDFLIADDEEPRAVRVAFILNEVNDALRSKGVLFSIHDEDVPVFRLLRLRARRAPGLIEDAKDVLLKLFDADAEYSADALEGIYDELEKVSKQVLAGEVTDTLAGEVLGDIARQEDLNGRIRRNVMDTRRAVSFMMRSRMLSAGQFEESRQILRDIESLDNHTAFLFDKINFLMDATVGFININQNKIIKIFSVASVALLPPTLVASLYGMNLKFPEFELLGTGSYPYVLVLMAAARWCPCGTSASAAGYADGPALRAQQVGGEVPPVHGPHCRPAVRPALPRACAGSLRSRAGSPRRVNQAT
jgi:magnesium transporter